MEIALSIDKNIISPTEKDRFCSLSSLFSVTGFGQKMGRMKCRRQRRNWNYLVSGEKVYEIFSCSYQRQD